MQCGHTVTRKEGKIIMNKKKIIILSTGLIVLSILSVLLVTKIVHYISLDKLFGRTVSDNSQIPTSDTDELGTLTISETEEPIIEDEDDYIGQPGDDIIYKEYYVGFTNLELVYEYLTIDATSRISDEAAEYLNDHGYGECHSLTIIESSIIKDKAYPKFNCTLEGIEDKILEIRYNLEKGEYEFQFI